MALFIVRHEHDARLAPFEAAGSVEIVAASTCVRVVASGGCEAILSDRNRLGYGNNAVVSIAITVGR